MRSFPAAALLRGSFALFLIVWPLIAPTASARQPARLTPAQFRARLERVLSESSLAGAVTGVEVVRLDDGRSVAAANERRLLHPASNMKLLTTAAALAHFPPGHTLVTRLFAGPVGPGGVIAGDLCIAGGGDPLLDTVDVDSLAGMAVAAGIRRVEGDLVADVSLFDTVGWGKGWMWDDEPDPDEPFVSPLTFNSASVGVCLRPGPRPGDLALVDVFPAQGYFSVSVDATTLPAGEPDSVVVTRTRGREEIRVDGTVSISSPPETTFVSVRFPAMHVLRAFRERLLSRGVEIAGAEMTGRAAGASIGAIERPLAEVLAAVNKQSDNLAAECVLKLMGARAAGIPGSVESGLAVLRGYLGGIGADSAGAILADGSGVSWYNALAPSHFTAILRDQYERRATFQAYLSSLAVAGVDGTLSGRMTGAATSGRVFGKTGTLTGVSALSGYAWTVANEPVAFSIIVNHFPGRVSSLRAIQDAIVGDIVRIDFGGRPARSPRGGR